MYILLVYERELSKNDYLRPLLITIIKSIKKLIKKQKQTTTTTTTTTTATATATTTTTTNNNNNNNNNNKFIIIF